MNLHTGKTFAALTAAAALVLSLTAPSGSGVAGTPAPNGGGTPKTTYKVGLCNYVDDAL